jgi:hypothetical protein
LIDPAYYESMSARTSGLLDAIATRLTSGDVKDCRILIDANEFGAALELMSVIAKSGHLDISAAEFEEFRSLASAMGLALEIEWMES